VLIQSFSKTYDEIHTDRHFSDIHPILGTDANICMVLILFLEWSQARRSHIPIIFSLWHKQVGKSRAI
jgi:hypothetical protein